MATPPTTPPPPPPFGNGTKPGWGKGDKNHVHTGPPGQSRRRSQGNRGASEHGSKGPKHAENSHGENETNQGTEEQHGNGNGNGHGHGHGNH